jgi:predicted O-linked N-acetylglucosamine transferase (SPINDLY family)
MFAAWMRILAAVPGSVLWLLADNDTARENMLRAADAQGVARQRLIFAPRVAPAEYLARFQLADLMLDTFPFNAGTTASDALWMGLPIVTRAGRTYISRMAGSLLTAVGLPDLITESLADYEKLAITLGREPRRVASRTSATWPSTAAAHPSLTCRRSCATSKPSSNAWPWPPEGPDHPAWLHPR